MKTEVPLQGIKVCENHPVIHISLLIA